jgi:hypothetical protein
MGERRLRILEGQLPADTFVLGVDSHTALVLDLDRGSASVSGLGGVTVRVDGRSAVFPSGSEMEIEALAEVARALAAGDAPDVSMRAGGRGTGAGDVSGADASFAGESFAEADIPGLVAGQAPRTATTIGQASADLEAAFFAALDGGDTAAAVAALLDFDTAIEARSHGDADIVELDNARSTFQSLIVRLGEAAAAGGSDPRATVEPFVEALLAVRARARETRDWATADLVRDRLIEAGVEVRDGAEGSTWVLAEPPAS